MREIFTKIFRTMGVVLGIIALFITLVVSVFSMAPAIICLLMAWIFDTEDYGVGEYLGDRGFEFTINSKENE